MKQQIFIDSKKRPELFYWNNPIQRTKLRKWFFERKIKVSDDLFDFFCKTGGGEIFEGETILGPFGDKTLGENLEETNIYYWNKGMPKTWLLFHVGLGNSALNMNTFEVIIFNSSSFEIIGTFRSFHEWYNLYIREEYKQRYGLK